MCSDSFFDERNWLDVTRLFWKKIFSQAEILGNIPDELYMELSTFLDFDVLDKSYPLLIIGWRIIIPSSSKYDLDVLDLSSCSILRDSTIPDGGLGMMRKPTLTF